jgi:sugar phosphate isomerase/epimerase
MVGTQIGNRIGVCSWSLRAEGVQELVERVRATELAGLQIALNPLVEGGWQVDPTLEALDRAGITLLSGMMAMRGEDYSSLEAIERTGGLRPSEYWPANRACAAECARLARAMGLGRVSFHAGFLPREPDHPERPVLIERLREVAGLFEEQGVQALLETGQESAETLLGVLEEIEGPSIGVNFDPANMILYDKGEPTAALRRLAPWVRQIHVKDARRTRVPGTWGEEVPVGTGDVDWGSFFALLRAEGLGCDLVIEREAGADRLGDIRRARDLILSHLQTD